MQDFCNFSTLRPGWRFNRFLILPAGFEALATPDATSPEFSETPGLLFDRLEAAIAGEPRIQWLAGDRIAGRMELIQRSRIFRFPDRVSIAIAPCADGSAPAIYSRAQVGIWDFGVNRARVRRWTRALEAG